MSGLLIGIVRTEICPAIKLDSKTVIVEVPNRITTPLCPNSLYFFPGLKRIHDPTEA